MQQVDKLPSSLSLSLPISPLVLMIFNNCDPQRLLPFKEESFSTFLIAFLSFIHRFQPRESRFGFAAIGRGTSLAGNLQLNALTEEADHFML